MLLTITIILVIASIIVDVKTIQKIRYKPATKVYEKWIIDADENILYIDDYVNIDIIV